MSSLPVRVRTYRNDCDPILEQVVNSTTSKHVWNNSNSGYFQFPAYYSYVENRWITWPTLTVPKPCDLLGLLRTYVVPADGISGSSSENSYYTGSKVVTMTDYVVPNFKARSRAGEIFNNPMTRECFEATVKKVPKVKHNTTESSYSGSYLVLNNESSTIVEHPLNLSEATLRTLCDNVVLPSINKDAIIGKAYGKVNAGAFTHGVELAEGKETFAHVAQQVGRMAKLVRQIKRGNFSKLAPRLYRKLKRQYAKDKKGFLTAVVDNIQDIWMEARYAWRPLLISAENAIKLYDEGLQLTDRVTARAHGLESDFGNNTTTLTADGQVITFDYTWTSSTLGRAGILSQVENNAQTLKYLGMTDLAGIAFELTPLSFVASWFVEFGGLLYCLSPNIGVKTLAAWYSQEQTVKLKGLASISDLDGNLIESTQFEVERSIKSRDPVTGPPLLTIDVDLDIVKLLDITAILRGMVS